MSKLTADTIKAESGQFDLESVLHLDVSGMDLSDISELQKCTNLKRLAVASNQIDNLKPLENLEKLEYLDVRYNGLATLEGIDTMPALRTLYAQGNTIGQLNELNVLNGHPSLSVIYFQDRDGSTASPVCQHPSYFVTLSKINERVRIIDGEHLMLRASAESIELTGEVSRDELGIQPSRPWLGPEMERAQKEQDDRNSQGMLDKTSKAKLSRLKEEFKAAEDLDRRARLLLR
eukprot:gb/GECG01007785.1/.p1 GENE.gb/GECG01007785.1/~~gb/GECG01007785.1/.p1  ORF type:complete len:233 (+),score=32.30 gb/GECG01007785.1/:1-699(+)